MENKENKELAVMNGKVRNINYKRIATQIAAGVTSLGLIFMLGRCSVKKSNNGEISTPPAVSVETPTPTPSETPKILVDTNTYTMDEYERDVIDLQEKSEKITGVSITTQEALDFILHQNLYSIDDDVLAEINAKYYRNKLDIDEIMDNAYGVISVAINHNMSHSSDEFFSLNYCDNELNYLIYNKIESDFLRIRAMFEDKTMSAKERDKEFGLWLYELEKFLVHDRNNKDNSGEGTITIHGQYYDGKYLKSSMTPDGEITLDYLCMYIQLWVNTVYNNKLTGNFDAINDLDSPNRSEIQIALNRITNSVDPATELNLYLEGLKENELTEEEIDSLKATVALYNVLGLAESIKTHSAGTYAGPALKFDYKNCPQGQLEENSKGSR